MIYDLSESLNIMFSTTIKPYQTILLRSKALMMYNNRGILACEQLLSTYSHHLIKALRIWENFSSNITDLYRQMDTD